MSFIPMYLCDHCGKPLDMMVDYPEMDIEVCWEEHKCDLCAGCVSELSGVVSEFIRKNRLSEVELTEMLESNMS